MSRSRHPKCPHGRASCRICTNSVGAYRRKADASKHADAVPDAMAERDDWYPDDGAWEIPHMDRL